MSTNPDPLEPARALLRRGLPEQARLLLGPLAEAPCPVPEALSLLGAALLELGEPAQAEGMLRRALGLTPAAPLVRHNLATALLSQGKHDEAAPLLEGLLQEQPADAALLCNLAGARAAQGSQDEALGLYDRALALDANLPQAHNNRANLLRERGRWDEALAGYRQALALAPRFALAARNLAELLLQRGRHSEGEQALRQASAHSPEDARTRTRLAHLLLVQGKSGEALAAATRATELAPEDAEAWNSKGNAHRALAQPDEAEDCYRASCRLAPDWSAPLYNLGVVLLGQGRHEEARACLGQAVALAPEDAQTAGTAAGALHFDAQATPEEILAAHTGWAQKHAPSRPGPAHANVPDPGRRLRVGYVSPDFRNHAVAFFLRGVLENHDASQVEVFAYAEVPAPDETTREFQGLIQHWRPTCGLSDEELAALVRQDGIDVLVELAGHTTDSRLRAFSLCPAPVQLSWLGYPGSTWMDCVRYRLSDAVADPPGSEAHYREELVRLPGPFCCYRPPPLPACLAGSQDVLPSEHQGVLTFGSLNKLDKLNDSVVALWCEVLRALPCSRLLLARDGLRGRVADFWRRTFQDAGLQPQRLLLETARAMQMGHLELYGRIDVALDPFPFTGHTTACEALAMGVPVVSLRGGRYAGRMVASVLHHAGLGDLAADTPEEYVRTASSLAEDVQRRRQLRRDLPGLLRDSALGDAAAFTRGLEGAYRDLWRRWCRGQPREAGSERVQGAEKPVRGAEAMSKRYLVGPVDAQRARLWDEARQRGECLAFGPDGVDLTVTPGDRWPDVLARLPAGFQPDYLVLWLGYSALAPCLLDAPLPVVALAPDWQLQWHCFRQFLPRCELIFTDTAGVEVMHRQGIEQVRQANLFGLDPSWLEVEPSQEGRDIDILFVGNMQPAVQSERLPWLGRLASLRPRWRVEMASGVFGPDYRALLRRSRVVFNRSVRGEWNLRVLEALACGALLFQERDNREVPGVLTDGQECVLYGERDLEDLLDRYLGDEQLRRRVASAGQKRAKEFTFPCLWQKVADLVEQEWPALQARQAKRPHLSPLAALRLRGWLALCAGGEQADPALPGAIASTLLDRPADSHLHNLLGVLRGGPGRDGKVGAEEARRAAPHFERAVATDSRHAVAALNLIGCLLGLEQRDLALTGARQLLLGLAREGASSEALDAPTFPLGFSHLRVAWEEAAWANAGDPEAERRDKEGLLRWALHSALGQMTGDLAHLHEAALARPELAPSRLTLGLALGQAGRHAEAALHLESAHRAEPLDPVAAFNAFVARSHVGDVSGARKLARQRRWLRQSAPGLVPAERWFEECAPVGDELVSILILCCDQLEYTKLCVESLVRHTRSPYELIFVDNGSTDGTEGYLRKLRSRPGPQRVELIINAKNVGYPAGCNQALRKAKGDWVVFLNNDTVVTEGWLEGLLGWATHDWPKVGMVGPVTSASRPPQEIPVGYSDLANLPAFASRRRREFAGKAQRVQRLTGFCLLARREVLRQVGGHDERYGLGFFDDDDLSVRVLRAGYQLLVAHDVFVHHFGSRTFKGLGIDTKSLLSENLERFREKWGEQEAAGYQFPHGPQPGPAPRPAPAAQADTPVMVQAPGQRGSVSLCLIVKNEEDNLPACLESARGLAGEVVVVDTGSTDRTREIALQMGAKVFDFPWCDSFSAARNACLENASGDFIFWLDADDRLDAENSQRLKDLFASLRKGDLVAFTMKCRCLPQGPGAAATLVDHVRLFPRHPKVRWRYRVHEQILHSLRELGVRVERAAVVIHHTGYVDAALRGRKLQRDLRLLQMEHAENPDEPFVLFNLGSIHHECGEPGKALPLLQRSLELSHPKDSIVRKLFALVAQCHARLGRLEEALNVLSQGRRVEPEDAELLYLEGLLRKEAGDRHGARACFTALLQGPPSEPAFASVADGLRSWRPSHELACLCRDGGDLPGAEALWRRVAQERPDFLPAWTELGHALLDQGRHGELDDLLERTRAVPGGEPEAEVLACRCLIAQGHHSEARHRAEALVGRWPDFLRGRIAHSHALLVEGADLPACERAIREILRLDPNHAQAKRNLEVVLARMGGSQGAPGPGTAALEALDATFASQEVRQEQTETAPLEAPAADGTGGQTVRVAVVSIVHNEEDLIVPFLEHYLSLGVERVVLVDNDCSDSTLEKAARFPFVEVIRLDSGGCLDDDLRNSTFQQRREALAEYDHCARPPWGLAQLHLPAEEGSAGRAGRLGPAGRCRRAAGPQTEHPPGHPATLHGAGRPGQRGLRRHPARRRASPGPVCLAAEAEALGRPERGVQQAGDPAS